MSHTHTIGGMETDSTGGLLTGIALATTVVAIAFTTLGVYGDGSGGSDPGLGEFLVVCGISVAAAGIVFGFVVPRALRKESAGGTALTLSLLGAASVLVFWLGVAPALAVGGAILGWAGRSAARGHVMSQAAFVIGVLAAVAYVAGYVLDWMSTNGML